VQYQNITVQTVQGPVEGRIGTKKPYTDQDLNQQGQWDCETASSSKGTYNKFKKHYDKPYQGQSTSQNTQPSPQQAAQGTNSPPRDYDAENRGKVRTQFIKAAIISGDLRCRSFADVLTLTEFAMTGIDPNQPVGNQSAQDGPIKAQFCDECRNLKEECTCGPSY
ncbi:unnamed protein product, partial [marine sediment metagenome]